MAARGLLLAFEGVDGCGKSTQVRRCATWCADRWPDREVVVLREPGGTSLGEQIRGLLLDGESMSARTETLLYMAARAELYARSVLPALARGDIVILDRSHYSTAAYQGAGLGVDTDRILDLASWCNEGREPERVVLVDVPPAVAAARRGGAGGGDRIERRDEAYFDRVAQAFRALAERFPERFRVVDGGADEVAVAARVAEVLDDVDAG